MLQLSTGSLPIRLLSAVALKGGIFLVLMLALTRLQMPSHLLLASKPNVYVLIFLLTCSAALAACAVAADISYAGSLRHGFVNALRESLVAAVIAVPLCMGYAHFGDLALDQILGFLGVSIGLVPPTAVLVAFCHRSLAGGRFRRRVVIAGDAVYRERIRQAAVRTPRSFEIVGYCDFRTGVCEQYAASGKCISHQAQRIQTFLSEVHADELVVALRERRAREAGGGGLPVWELLELKARGVRVTELTDFWERHAGQLELELLQPASMLFIATAAQNRAFQLFKRSFDILTSLVLLVSTLPLFIVCAAGVKLTSRGPVLFRQERVGLHGRTFTLYKLRTMSVDAERYGPKWTSGNDSRVTPLGKFLRTTRIDELPQLLNVLKGEMSMVGPRPERPHFVAQLRASSRFYDLRHHVKPGLTGWAQVSQGYAASIEESVRKLSYDLYYIKNCSIGLELFILLRTIGVVLWRENAR